MDYGIFCKANDTFCIVLELLLSISTLSDLGRVSFIAGKAASYLQNAWTMEFYFPWQYPLLHMYVAAYLQTNSWPALPCIDLHSCDLLAVVAI